MVAAAAQVERTACDVQAAGIGEVADHLIVGAGLGEAAAIGYVAGATDDRGCIAAGQRRRAAVVQDAAA